VRQYIISVAFCTEPFLLSPMLAQVNHDDRSTVQCRTDNDGSIRIKILGRWDIRAVRERPRELLERLRSVGKPEARWDLTQIKDIDAAGGALIWQAWNRIRPRNLLLRTEDAWVLDNLAALPLERPVGSTDARARVNVLGSVFDVLLATADIIALLGAVALDSVALLRSPRDIPRTAVGGDLERRPVRVGDDGANRGHERHRRARSHVGARHLSRASIGRTQGDWTTGGTASGRGLD
jgi:hypothetical protein